MRSIRLVIFLLQYAMIVLIVVYDLILQEVAIMVSMI